MRTAVAALGGRVRCRAHWAPARLFDMTLTAGDPHVDRGHGRSGRGTFRRADRVRHRNPPHTSRPHITDPRTARRSCFATGRCRCCGCSNCFNSQLVERGGAASKVLDRQSGSHSVGVEVDGVERATRRPAAPHDGLLSGMRGVVGTALLGDGRVFSFSTFRSSRHERVNRAMVSSDLQGNCGAEDVEPLIAALSRNRPRSVDISEVGPSACGHFTDVAGLQAGSAWIAA